MGSDKETESEFPKSERLLRKVLTPEQLEEWEIQREASKREKMRRKKEERRNLGLNEDDAKKMASIELEGSLSLEMLWRVADPRKSLDQLLETINQEDDVVRQLRLWKEAVTQLERGEVQSLRNILQTARRIETLDTVGKVREYDLEVQGRPSGIKEDKIRLLKTMFERGENPETII